MDDLELSSTALRTDTGINWLRGEKGSKKRGQSSLLTQTDGFRQRSAMPRKLRIEFEGAIFHVMNRGDRREPIFRDDGDRRRFLETLVKGSVLTIDINGWFLAVFRHASQAAD